VCGVFSSIDGIDGIGGSPIYPGAGGVGLSNGTLNTAAVIADLNICTAKILKRLMPDCRLHGLSLGSNKPEVFEACRSEADAGANQSRPDEIRPARGGFCYNSTCQATAYPPALDD